jgi:hypothetical protein
MLVSWATMSAFMVDLLVSQALEHLVLVQRMSADIRSGGPSAGAEIERVLEVGFGCLVGLEAELQNRQVASRGQIEGDAPDGFAELHDSILRLSDGLQELRTLSSPYSSPRIGYGFVLPPSRPHPSRA